jgi:hypothetical protein
MGTTISLEEVPVIILGAGRSGTKLLRGILASHPETACFPREINYLWRHGNAGYPTDELQPEHAHPEVVRYIRKRFRALSARHNGARVVEKTCANALRVDFVHAVFPQAYIIHLVRDGRAVAESARRCWKARPELDYLLEKMRWVPVSDIPYYALRYLHYQLGRLRSDQGAESSWGPRFEGLDALVREKSLIEVCGLQWKACVQAAEIALKRLPSDQTITVRYEDLVTNPLAVIGRLFDQINLMLTAECRAYIEREVSADYVDKWQERLTERDLNLLLPHIEAELLKHRYEV